MTAQILVDHSRIPSIQHFLGLLTEDLASRRSILVLLPTGVDSSEVWALLQTELWRREFWVTEISLPDLPSDCPPVVALSESLGVSWPSDDTPRTVANLMATEDLPDVVQLDGLDELHEGTREAWLAFLARWREASHSLVDGGRVPTALCVITPAKAVLHRVPESDVRLALHWWWGFPSALEVRLLCRLANGTDSSATSARWREHLLPALAGSDLSLARFLWDDLRADDETLIQRLRLFAEEQGWSVRDLSEWGAERWGGAKNYAGIHQMSSPPVKLRPLWMHGALSWTLEYGLELHPAALALLDRQEELRHRLWRGQAELLLPLLDDLRLTVCGSLTRAHGRDWPVRWYQPASPIEEEEVEDNPLACGWGYLAWLLRKCSQLGSERRLLSLVSQAHRIRNELAHYRPVAFRDFERLWGELHRVSRHTDTNW